MRLAFHPSNMPCSWRSLRAGLSWERNFLALLLRTSLPTLRAALTVLRTPTAVRVVGLAATAALGGGPGTEMALQSVDPVKEAI